MFTNAELLAWEPQAPSVFKFGIVAAFKTLTRPDPPHRFTPHSPPSSTPDTRIIGRHG